MFQRPTTAIPPRTSKRLAKLTYGGFNIVGGSVVVFTDGSCFNGGQADARAGIGIYWGKGSWASDLNASEPLPGELQTSNRAELFMSLGVAG